MKKKILAALLAMTMFISAFSGCAGRNADIKRFGDEPDTDTLRICIDAENQSGYKNEYSLDEYYTKLIGEIKSGLGIENVALEILPGNGVERETALHRMRTEIMSGGGPDVFILNTVEGNYTETYEGALLNFPEKNMESGLFLPLDEYMENNTRFTDWNMQTKAVLDAGRTEEGQVVIPLTYTFPVTVYPRHEAIVPYATDLTMQEILENPETAELGAALYTSMNVPDRNGDRVIPTTRLAFLLGALADYDTDELLFTEDELRETISTMLRLHEDAGKNPNQCIQSEAGYYLLQEIDLSYFDAEMALVPHYSRNGGVTATVLSYAAVNRNTRFPKEAFSVIDFILQEKMQLESELYSFLLGRRDLPLQNDLGQEAKPLYMDKYFEPAMFNDLLEIKKLITEVNFKSELNMALQSLLLDCVLSNTASEANVSETYAIMKRMMGE